MVNLSHDYLQWVIERLNGIEENLWFNLDRVPQLDPLKGEAVLVLLLKLACHSQNIANIEIGRKGILAIPKEWVLHHIEQLAEPLLQLEDDWEYRRLLEVYELLDDSLKRRLAVRAKNHSNPDIREAGEDFLE